MSQPLTHDVRVVLGPILLASADASPVQIDLFFFFQNLNAKFQIFHCLLFKILFQLTDAADCIIASTTGEEVCFFL